MLYLLLSAIRRVVALYQDLATSSAVLVEEVELGEPVLEAFKRACQRNWALGRGDTLPLHLAQATMAVRRAGIQIKSPLIHLYTAPPTMDPTVQFALDVVEKLRTPAAHIFKPGKS